MFTRSALLAAVVLFGCPRDDSLVPPAPEFSTAATEQVEPPVRATNSEAGDSSEVIVIEEVAPTGDRQAREQPITQRRSTGQNQSGVSTDMRGTANETNTTDDTNSTTTESSPASDATDQAIGGGDTYDRNR